MTVARRRVVGATTATVLAATAVAAVWAGPWRADDRAGAPRDATGAQSSTSPPNEVTDGDGTEVIRRPVGSPASSLAALRPAAAVTTDSLIGEVPPGTTSRRRAVVEGYPLSVVPVLPGSTVDSSGVSSTRGAVQVSLVARSPKASDQVLAFYRRALVGHGFVESVVPASAGAVAAGFRRGDDHLVVTTSRAGKATSYSVFGSLHVGADD